MNCKDLQKMNSKKQIKAKKLIKKKDNKLCVKCKKL